LSTPTFPLDALLSKLQAADAEEIVTAIQRLRELLPSLAPADLRRSVEALCGLFYIDLYDRPDLQLALDAAEMALVRAGEPVIPILIRQMEGSDIKSHFHLARVLGRIGAASLPHLRRLVATAEDAYSRSFALFAIGKIKEPIVHEALTEVVGALMHPDKEVRDSAARTLGKIVEAVPRAILTDRRRREIYEALARAIVDTQPAVRAKAVRSIGKMALHGYLDEEMRLQARARIQAILTRGEETDWDHAFIVRREAQETLAHLTRSGDQI
jgi:HEAT repeat protein